MGTLDKGLDILETILKNNRELTLGDLSTLTGLKIATAHRVSSLLVKRGYLLQRKRGKYSLGLKLLRFSDLNNYATLIRDVAMPHLKNLSEELSEISALTVLNGLQGFDIAINFHPHSLVVNMDIFGISPLHCTSVGKILMANMSQRQIDMVIKQGLKAYTKNTITDPNVLKREIETVRRKNVAIDDEEYGLDIRSVARPIELIKGELTGAICIVAPSVRLSRERIRAVVPIIEKYALGISNSLLNEF